MRPTVSRSPLFERVVPMHGPLTASRVSAAGSVKSSLCGGGNLSFSALRRCGILYGGLHAHSAASARLTEQAIYQDEKND